MQTVEEMREELEKDLSMWKEDSYPLLLSIMRALTEYSQDPSEICASITAIQQSMQYLTQTEGGKRAVNTFKEIVDQAGMAQALALHSIGFQKAKVLADMITSTFETEGEAYNL